MDNQPPPVQNPVQQTLPSTPKSFLSSKLILIGVILILVLSAGGTYLALNSKPKPAPIVSKEPPASVPTPTIDPTASWKTYNNTKYGYSMRYPSAIFTGEVNIEEKSNGDVAFNYFRLPLSSGSYPHSINIYATQTIQSVKDYVDQIRVGDGLNPKLTRESITIGGRQGERVLGVPSANGQILVVIPNGNNLLNIVLDPYVPGQDMNENEWIRDFDTILSTFKFTQ